MSIVILDLDNCISNDEWRREFIDWKEQDIELRFKEYHNRCHLDQVGNQQLFTNTPHDVVIMTSRPERYREQTEDWLAFHEVRAQEVFMSPQGSQFSSRALKYGYVQRLFELHQITASDIVCAYDDNPSVVVMYRSLGIASECVAIHGIYKCNGVV